MNIVYTIDCFFLVMKYSGISNISSKFTWNTLVLEHNEEPLTTQKSSYVRIDLDSRCATDQNEEQDLN